MWKALDFLGWGWTDGDPDDPDYDPEEFFFYALSGGRDHDRAIEAALRDVWEAVAEPPIEEEVPF